MDDINGKDKKITCTSQNQFKNIVLQIYDLIDR